MLRARFQDSLIQSVKRSEINIKIAGISKKLETCTIYELPKLQGEIAALRQILSIL